MGLKSVKKREIGEESDRDGEEDGCRGIGREEREGEKE